MPRIDFKVDRQPLYRKYWMDAISSILYKDISIIVPVKNNQEGIVRLLTSFFHYINKKNYPKEIILVDNNSNVPLYIPANFLTQDLPIYLLNCQAEGAGNARNIGAKLATKHGASWIFFIDSDCLFTETTLSGYVSADTGYAVAYQGRIRAAGKDWLSKFYEFYEVLTPLPYLENGKFQGPLFLVTASTLIYLHAFNQISGFDKEFTVASEDVELGHRLAEIGNFVYAKDSWVQHDFLNGESIVKNKHILELLGRFGSYVAGDKFLNDKYLTELKAYEKNMADNPEEEVNNLSRLAYLSIFIHLKRTQNLTALALTPTLSNLEPQNHVCFINTLS